MNSWREAGIAPPTLAVNVSLGQLKAADEFVDVVMQTLAKWGLAPKDLELDVTESMLAHVTLMQNTVLDRLMQLGVQIAIDDFGTQYSSLDYLKTYHVSRLKIPRSMIEAATHDPNDSAMVRAIIGFARELDIEVVAQGIETETQRALLSPSPSTTKVQGYYYCEPVQARTATELLRQRLIEPRLKDTNDAAPAA
jgi:EAL domain-containing protein (putative c-di-GMP-specific phosphodiesterase class I)